MDYYISQDTYDQLPPDIQKQVMSDTKEHDKQGGGEMAEESSEPTDETKNEQCSECGHEPDNEKPRTWDDAHKKGIALIIAAGKKKDDAQDD